MAEHLIAAQLRSSRAGGDGKGGRDGGTGGMEEVRSATGVKSGTFLYD